MNNEIKEILEDVKRHLDYVEATKQASVRDNQMKVMYDYITNLQKENERQKENLLNLNKTIKKVKKENKNMKEYIEYTLDEYIDYKSRIDKAIKYIEKSMNNPQPFYEYLHGDENGEVDNLDKLLNILQGSDE